MVSLNDIFRILKNSLPFILGILIGAGITRNWWSLMIILVIVLLGTIQTEVSNHKGAIKQIRKKASKWYVGQVAKGMDLGDTMFDKGYSNYIFFFNILLLGYMIYYLWRFEWLVAGVLFLVLNIMVIQNQVWRKLK